MPIEDLRRIREKISAPMKEAVNVTRKILIFVNVIITLGSLALKIINPLVMRYTEDVRRADLLDFLLFTPVIMLCLSIILYKSLKPIRLFAASPGTLTKEQMLEVRKTAFNLPLKTWLLLNAIVLPVVAVVGLGFDAVVFPSYPLYKRLISMWLIWTFAISMSFTVYIYVKHLMVPILKQTSAIGKQAGLKLGIKTKVVATTITLTAMTALFLSVYSYSKTREALGPESGNEIASFTLAMTFFFMSLAAGISYYVANDISHAIRDLEKRMKSISTKEEMCHKGLEIISLDEVGDLTQAFNDLQSTIHSYHQQLDAANNKMLEMERQQKETMRALFSNYVSPKIVEELLKIPDGTKLGGERRNITVLFCDIRGFVSISEKLLPEEVVTVLNEYFMEASEIIFKWDGTLDKFIGDAVLAFWGAPTDQINQTELSVRCALAMSKRLLQLQRKWAEKGKVIFECGMGITSGNAIVGNVGSLGKKMDYTAIGNCVNLCSRLQSLSKEHKTGIFVTEEIMQYIQSALTCRQLGHCALRKIGPIRVRGKEKEVIIYALDDLPHGV